MRNWFSTPPCTSMKEKRVSPTRLELIGPGIGERLGGGLTAVVGAGVATLAARHLRGPLPSPFKVVPIIIGAAGAGVSALGAHSALSEHSVVVEAGRGVTFRWRPGPFAPHKLELKAAEVAAVEAIHGVERLSYGSEFDRTTSVDVYRVTLVARDGRAVMMEKFYSRTQADLRVKQVERLLAAKGPVGASRGKRRPNLRARPKSARKPGI